MYKYIEKSLKVNKDIIFWYIFSLFQLCCLLLITPTRSYAMVPAAMQEIVRKQIEKASFSVSPVIEDLVLIPGKLTTYDLTITNNSLRPLGMHATAERFSQSGDTIYGDSPLPSWISITSNDIILAPSEKKVIEVTILPPKETKDGGYYGMVLLTPFVSNQQDLNQPVILSKVGTLIFGTIGKLDFDNLLKKVSIVAFNVGGFISDKKNLTISFGIHNSYFTHFIATPTITITPLLFGNSQTIMLEEKHILPQTTRTWNQNVVFPSDYTLYQTKLAISLGNGKQIFATQYNIVFPYKIFFSIIIFIILLYICVRKRNNFKKAIRILINKDYSLN